MKTRTWVSSGIFFCAALMCFSSCKEANSKKTAHTQEQIKVIEIANRELSRLGVAVDEKDVHYDSGNAEWSREFARYRTEDPDGAMRLDVLNDREYHTVRYTPKQKRNRPILGGGYWVFVDRETNKVITWLGEQ